MTLLKRGGKLGIEIKNLNKVVHSANMRSGS